jgi:WD40 repeat protein
MGAQEGKLDGTRSLEDSISFQRNRERNFETSSISGFHSDRQSDISADMIRQLDAEIAKRARLIDDCKKKITTHAAEIINTIELLCVSALEKIDDLARNIPKGIEGNKYPSSEAQKIKNILSTEIRLSFNALYESKSMFAEYFTQKFIEIKPKTDIIALKQKDILNSDYAWRGFLATHSGRINTVLAMKNERNILSGGSDNTIKIWNIQTGNIEGLLLGHIQEVHCMATNNENSLLVSGSPDMTLRLWDLNKRKQLAVLQENKEIAATVAFSLDSQWIAAGTNLSVQIWSVMTKTILKKLDAQGQIIGVVFLGNTLLSASTRGQIVEWEYLTGVTKQNIQTKNNVTSVAVSSDFSKFVVGTTNGELSVRNLSSSETSHGKEESGSMVTSVSFANNDEYVISALADSTISIWDIVNKQYLLKLEGHSDSVNCISLINQYSIVSCSSDCSMISWRLPNERRHLQLYPFDFSKAVYCDNIMAYLYSNTLYLWDCKANKLDAELQLELSPFICVDISSKFVITAHEDRIVMLWNRFDKSKERILSGHQDRINCVAIVDKIAVSGSDDKTIRVWGVEEHQPKCVLKNHTSGVNNVALARKGILVSCAKDNKIIIWNISTMQALHEVTDISSEVLHLCIVSDDYFTVIDRNNDITLFVLASGEFQYKGSIVETAETVFKGLPDMRGISKRWIR